VTAFANEPRHLGQRRVIQYGGVVVGQLVRERGVERRAARVRRLCHARNLANEVK
jgi:hypothetical protein